MQVSGAAARFLQAGANRARAVSQALPASIVAPKLGPCLSTLCSPCLVHHHIRAHTNTCTHTCTRAPTHTQHTCARTRSCVAKHGLGKWSEIAHDLNKLLAGPHHRKRSSKQCRERWIHHLSPSVNKGVSWECVLRRGTKSCCEHGTHA